MKDYLRILATGLLALLASCGGGGGDEDSSPSPVAAAPGTTAPAAPPPAAPAPASAPVAVSTHPIWTPVTAASLDALVGRWDFGCSTGSSGTSARSEYVIAKAGDSSVSVQRHSTQYREPNCTGRMSSTGGDAFPATYAIVGTKMADGDVTYGAGVSGPGVMFPYQEILVLQRDGRLYFGNPQGLKDAAGYPLSVVPLSGTKA